MTALLRLNAEGNARVMRSAGDAISPLAVLSVERRDDVAARVPALDDHLLVVTSTGFQTGTVVVDGSITGPHVSNRPGSLCLVPRARAMQGELSGHVSYVELLIGRGTMEHAAAELIDGDPAGLELAGFNSLLDPCIERLALRAAAHLYLHRGGDTPVDDAFALALCAELIKGYARHPLRAGTSATPRLCGLRLMKALEQLEHGNGHETRLDALARTAGLPPLAFVRAFEAETGLSLDAFVAERRIDRLRERLDALAANEPLDLDALAGALGYGGPSALERACVAALGTTPAGYLASRWRR